MSPVTILSHTPVCNAGTFADAQQQRPDHPIGVANDGLKDLVWRWLLIYGSHLSICL